MATILGIIAFIAIPFLNFAALVTGGIIANNYLRKYVIPNAGKIKVLETRIASLEKRIEHIKD